jgi:hypothetical protein
MHRLPTLSTFQKRKQNRSEGKRPVSDVYWWVKKKMKKTAGNSPVR